jgi:hypothetical protein
MALHQAMLKQAVCVFFIKRNSDNLHVSVRISTSWILKSAYLKDSIFPTTMQYAQKNKASLSIQVTPFSKTFLKWGMGMLFWVKSSANSLFGKTGTLLAH